MFHQLMKKLILSILLIAGAISIAPNARAHDDDYGEHYRDYRHSYYNDDCRPRRVYHDDDYCAPRRVYYSDDCAPRRHYYRPQVGLSFFFGR